MTSLQNKVQGCAEDTVKSDSQVRLFLFTPKKQTKQIQQNDQHCLGKKKNPETELLTSCSTWGLGPSDFCQIWCQSALLIFLFFFFYKLSLSHGTRLILPLQSKMADFESNFGHWDLCVCVCVLSSLQARRGAGCGFLQPDLGQVWLLKHVSLFRSHQGRCDGRTPHQDPNTCRTLTTFLTSHHFIRRGRGEVWH